MIASAVCFVHCVLTPVALSFWAVSAHYLPTEERFHRTMAVFVAAIGGFAVITGFRAHRRRRVLALTGAGLSCIFAGAYWGNLLPSHFVEVLVTLIGSCLMIAGHLANHTFCKQCQCRDAEFGESGDGHNRF